MRPVSGAPAPGSAEGPAPERVRLRPLRHGRSGGHGPSPAGAAPGGLRWDRAAGRRVLPGASRYAGGDRTVGGDAVPAVRPVGGDALRQPGGTGGKADRPAGTGAGGTSAVLL